MKTPTFFALAGMAASAAVLAAHFASLKHDGSAITRDAEVRRTAAAAPADRDELAALRQTLDSLRADLAAVRLATDDIRAEQDELKRDTVSVASELARQRASSYDTAAPGPELYSAREAGSSRESDLPIDDDAAGQVDRLAAMDGAMYAGLSDPDWENEAVRQLTAGFATSPGSRLQSVACHGALCRVEVFHEEAGALMAMLEKDGDLVPWSHKGRMETIEYDSGEITTVMYVTREGQEFPQQF